MNNRIDPITHAQVVWNLCVPADQSHPYILKKEGRSEGLRIYPPDAPQLMIHGQNVAGYLVVPCAELDGTLCTLQFVPPAGGNKLNLVQAKFGAGFFAVGEIAASSAIYLVDGIGQAWASWRATGRAALVCFGAGRMSLVAKMLRAADPGARLILVPDRGKEKQAEAIAKEVNGEWIVLPAEKPVNYDVNDFMREFGADTLGELLERTQRRSTRFKLLTGADLGAALPMSWLVRGALPSCGLAALYGPSGSGKSFLILDLAVTIASGAKHWFGRRVTQVPVTYVVLEGEAGMGKRVTAWGVFHQQPIPAALRFITQPIDLLSASDVDDLAEAIHAGGGAGGMVIIDTLNRSAPGADENSSVDMGHIIAAAKQLQCLIGGLVLLVHHTGKDASKGLRGHSSLYAALDGAIEVCRLDKSREWRVAKSKDDEDGHAYRFRLEVQVLGVDDEGDEITSCIVVPDTSVEAIKKQLKLPSGDNQKIAMDALATPLRNSSEFGKGGAPPGRPCIRQEDAVKLVTERLLCDHKRKRERAEKALTGLVARGIYGASDGWLWRT